MGSMLQNAAVPKPTGECSLCTLSVRVQGFRFCMKLGEISRLHGVFVEVLKEGFQPRTCTASQGDSIRDSGVFVFWHRLRYLIHTRTQQCLQICTAWLVVSLVSSFLDICVSRVGPAPAARKWARREGTCRMEFC